MEIEEYEKNLRLRKEVGGAYKCNLRLNDVEMLGKTKIIIIKEEEE